MDNLIFTVPEKFGILPGNFYLRKPSTYKVLAALHAATNFAIFMCPAAILALQSLQDDSNRFWVMSSIVILLVTSLTVIPVLYNGVLYPGDYTEMMNHFRKIKTILAKRSITIKTSWRVFKLVFFNVVFLVCNIITMSIFWGHMHPVLTILMLWPTYIWYLEVAVAWQILEEIRACLKQLNRLIDSMYKMNYLLTETESTIQHWKGRTRRSDEVEEVFDYIDIYERLTKIINIFNKLFGSFNVLLVFSFLIEFVAVIYRIIAGTADMESVYMDFISALIHTVQWLIFVVKSQHVIDEGKNCVEICLETTFRALREPDVTAQWKEGMAHLSLYVTTNGPSFTAAKFFIIDYSSIFTIFNMLTGYIIVAVQFAETLREVDEPPNALNTE